MRLYLSPRPSPADPPGIAALERLGGQFGERATRNASILQQHGGGEALRDVRPLDLVVFSAGGEKVCEIVRLCAQALAPIVAFGAALEGHVQALDGGVCIDLSRMDALIEVDPSALDCRLQAGMTREALNHALRDQGLCFPVDPGANATLAGKLGLMQSRHGAALDQMCAVKRALDPLNIMNPGKAVPGAFGP